MVDRAPPQATSSKVVPAVSTSAATSAKPHQGEAVKADTKAFAVLAGDSIFLAEGQFEPDVIAKLSSVVQSLGGETTVDRKKCTILLLNPTSKSTPTEHEHATFLRTNYPDLAQPLILPYHWLFQCLHRSARLALTDLDPPAPIFLHKNHPLKLWVSVNIRRRDAETPEEAKADVVRSLEVGGGIIVEKRAKADVLVVDTTTNFYLTVKMEKEKYGREHQRFAERDWVDGSVREGKVDWDRGRERKEREKSKDSMEDEDEVPRKRGPGKPVGQPRVDFTPEDDDFMMRYLAAFHRGGSWGSRKTYETMVNASGTYPVAKRHSSQSWHNRFKSNQATFGPRVDRMIRDGVDESLKTRAERQRASAVARTLPAPAIAAGPSRIPIPSAVKKVDHRKRKFVEQNDNDAAPPKKRPNEEGLREEVPPAAPVVPQKKESAEAIAVDTPAAAAAEPFAVEVLAPRVNVEPAAIVEPAVIGDATAIPGSTAVDKTVSVTESVVIVETVAPVSQPEAVAPIIELAAVTTPAVIDPATATLERALPEIISEPQVAISVHPVVKPAKIDPVTEIVDPSTTHTIPEAQASIPESTHLDTASALPARPQALAAVPRVSSPSPPPSQDFESILPRLDRLSPPPPDFPSTLPPASANHKPVASPARSQKSVRMDVGFASSPLVPRPLDCALTIKQSPRESIARARESVPARAIGELSISTPRRAPSLLESEIRHSSRSRSRTARRHASPDSVYATTAIPSRVSHQFTERERVAPAGTFVREMTDEERSERIQRGRQIALDNKEMYKRKIKAWSEKYDVSPIELGRIVNALPKKGGVYWDTVEAGLRAKYGF
ncbi:hypothetical protein P7C73_g31, partial [Tremellales sp. Uapishka_1]